MTWTNKMRLAVGFATERHEGQVDKSGMPYILHPLAVAKSLIFHGEYAFIVGVLHDLVEDTETSLLEIAVLFGVSVAEAVDAVSRRKDETYTEFILRSKAHPLGRLVKLADLAHNMSPERMANLPPEMQGISRRYEKALAILNEGDPGIHGT